MAKRVSARLSAQAGRKFGVTVGAAFLVLAAVVWWRAQPSIADLFILPAAWGVRHVAAAVMAGTGALLSLAALSIPTRLGPVERAWMGLAHGISRVTTPIVMGVVYFAVLTPIGVGMRLFGRNPMAADRRANSFWMHTDRQKSDMQRQF